MNTSWRIDRWGCWTGITRNVSMDHPRSTYLNEKKRIKKRKEKRDDEISRKKKEQ